MGKHRHKWGKWQLIRIGAPAWENGWRWGRIKTERDTKDGALFHVQYRKTKPAKRREK